MAFLTGRSWRALKSWFTAGGRGGWFVSQMKLDKDLVSSVAPAKHYDKINKDDKVLVDGDRKGPL